VVRNISLADFRAIGATAAIAAVSTWPRVEATRSLRSPPFLTFVSLILVAAVARHQEHRLILGLDKGILQSVSKAGFRRRDVSILG